MSIDLEKLAEYLRILGLNTDALPESSDRAFSISSVKPSEMSLREFWVLFSSAFFAAMHFPE